MAKHEFGIMQKEPSPEERFDTYEPQKYNCITVHDDFIEPCMIDLQGLDCYWHTLQRPEKGLAYYGITLIPPQSMDVLIRIFTSRNRKELIPLITLINKAKENRKYIIHFGI